MDYRQSGRDCPRIQAKTFGSSSEILPSEEEAEEDAAARECPGKKEAAITSHKRKYQRRTSRKELYKNIPIEEVKIDIPEEKRFCPGCNAPKYMMYSSFYCQQEEWSSEEINGYNSFEIFWIIMQIEGNHLFQIMRWQWHLN